MRLHAHRRPTPRITGSKKQGDEGAPLFAVRVHAIVRCLHAAAHAIAGSMFPVVSLSTGTKGAIAP